MNVQKAVLVVVLAALCLSVGQAQTPAAPKGVEQQLIKMEHDWADAVVKRDMAVLERNLADDYLSIDFEGGLWTKASALAALKSGEDVVTSAIADDIKVRVYGNAAVVTSRWTVKEQFKGRDISGQYRVTDTFIKRAGRWQCVATHGSKIAQK